VKPYGLLELRLQGEDEALIGATGGIGERVISPEASQLLTYMMHRVIEQGTGTRARLPGREAAGKTGTTQAARDAWFVGFTADYVAGVWMGYDDNTPLSGVTGGGLPAEIWHEVMVRIHDGLPVTPLPMIIPPPKNRPADGTDARPRPPGAPLPPGMEPYPEEPLVQEQPRQPRRQEDPVEALLRDLLGLN
jgi:penicillin-binding protein 1A